MLKEIVDETSHGKYDFMYLRIGESHLPQVKDVLQLTFCRFRQQLQVRRSWESKNRCCGD